MYYCFLDSFLLTIIWIRFLHYIICYFVAIEVIPKFDKMLSLYYRLSISAFYLKIICFSLEFNLNHELFLLIFL